MSPVPSLCPSSVPEFTPRQHAAFPQHVSSVSSDLCHCLSLSVSPNWNRHFSLCKNSLNITNVIRFKRIQVAENPNSQYAVSVTVGSCSAWQPPAGSRGAWCLWSEAWAQSQKARVHNPDSSIHSSVTLDNFINISVLSVSSVTQSSPPLDCCED